MIEIGLVEEILPLTFKSAKDIRDKHVLPRLCWDLEIIEEIIKKKRCIYEENRYKYGPDCGYG